MNIGEQIRTYRKAHNLTQEQVADALGVTAPAVNKWERAGSFPDITLLPALARLLEIDMNTLFSFHEELTEIEIANFVNALYERALTGEIAEAFADAQEKIRDYPHCTPLLYTCATLLSASLTLSAVPPEGREKYNARIRDWFTRASESDDANYRTATSWRCWRSPRATTTAPRNSSPGCQTRLSTRTCSRYGCSPIAAITMAQRCKQKRRCSQRS